MGKIMSAAMGGMDMTMGSSDDGPIETKYQAEPNLMEGGTVSDLKKALNVDINNKLFCGNYFDHGDTPKMQVALDALDIPNAILTEISYKIISVTAPDGTSVMRPDDRDIEKWGPHKLHQSFGNNSIAFPVQKGTKAERLDKGIVHFDITAPSGLAIVEFTKDDVGTSKKSGGISVTLRSIDKNSVSIAFKGGKTAEIIAYDATGGCLSMNSGMSSASSQSKQFNGFVERVKVAIAKDVATFGLDISCNLNKGKQEELPKEPSDNIRTRFDNDKVSSYDNYVESDFEDLTVEWKEAGENDWQDKLFITLPHAKFSGNTSWETHFLGAEGNILLNGSSQRSGNELAYTMDKGTLATAHAATGAIKIKANTSIKTLSFNNATAGTAIKKQLPSGKTITVTFDKNAVTLTAPDCKVLESRAYASNDRKLKANRMSHGDLKTYWGIPTRFEVDVADGQLEKTIPFLINERDVDAGTLKAFQDRVGHLKAATRAMKMLQQNTRRISSYEYDDTIASFYYLYDRKGNPREKALISKALAHSDPAGATRYGYTATAYKGYYFSRLKGTLKKDGTKQDNTTADQARTYKWNGGEFQFKPFSNVAGFVAIPVDKAMPTLCTSWQDVYISYCGADITEYIPESLYNTDWKKTKVLD